MPGITATMRVLCSRTHVCSFVNFKAVWKSTVGAAANIGGAVVVVAAVRVGI